jgi:hypothetical protein
MSNALQVPEPADRELPVKWILVNRFREEMSRIPKLPFHALQIGIRDRSTGNATDER